MEGRVRRDLGWVWVREGDGGLEEGKLKRVASMVAESELRSESVFWGFSFILSVQFLRRGRVGKLCEQQCGHLRKFLGFR